MKHNGAEMRERILRESIKLFLHKGFQGTSIKDITDSVNLTKGAMYWHFKSKNELLETILKEWETAFLNGLIGTVGAAQGDFLTKFKQYEEYAGQFATEHRDLCVAFDTISAEITGSGMQVEQELNRIFGRYHEFVCRLLEQGKKEHRIREEMETSVQAHVIIGMHKGILLEWYMKENEIDGRQLAKTFRTFMLSGILAGGKEE